MIDLFIRGMLFGLAIAAPVGPIGLLCIKRTIIDGRIAGFVSGLGAATADAIYGSIAALGLQAISNLILSFSPFLRIVGGLTLLWIGVTTIYAAPQTIDIAPAVSRRGLLAAYLSTLFLTLTNPATILIFTVIFAGLGLSAGMDSLAGITLVAGVAGGSALWWTILSGGVSFARGRVTPLVLRVINLISGVIISGFGVAAFVAL
ncbi:LysE/ArgO family amino acid transporter [Chloroflexus sp.]|uniref:LysE/ArgO family amino acid transporter n=1 Tax=Chloroflexus sp. TaxID=1904827 RepID=UPI00260CF987|nr:LysE family transporter [uncultured Chloroflexus sp.]